MARTKVAIACQGGGSQAAFTAGAMKGLLEAGARQNFEVVGLSGTSGGAVCSALAWYALRKGEQPIWGRVIDFWKDNIAQGWNEESFNQLIIDSMRLVNRGAFPILQLSPSSPIMQTMMSFLTLGSRRSFTDFPELIRKYIDFDEVARWGASPQRRPRQALPHPLHRDAAGGAGYARLRGQDRPQRQKHRNAAGARRGGGKALPGGARTGGCQTSDAAPRHHAPAPCRATDQAPRLTRLPRT